MARQLKNTTGSALFHPNSGVSFDPGYNALNMSDMANLMDSQMLSWISGGVIVLYDGIRDVTDPTAAWAIMEGTILPFSNAQLTSTNSAAAIEELRTTQPVVLSYDRAGLTIGGSYFMGGSGFIVPKAMRISEISVATGTTIALGTASIEIHRRTAFGSYSAISGASVSLGAGQYRNTATALSIAVAAGSEVCAYLAGLLSLSNVSVTLMLVFQ